MQKKILMLLILLLCMTILCSCGKSQMVKDTEAAIEAIGAVDTNSIAAIEMAEKYYSILTDDEKKSVSNREKLVNARNAYDSLPTPTPKPTATPSPVVTNGAAALKALKRAMNNPASVQVVDITRSYDNDMYLFDVSAENRLGGTVRDEFVVRYDDDTGKWKVVDGYMTAAFANFIYSPVTDDEIDQIIRLAN